MTGMPADPKTVIFYDGKCHLCSSEINVYRKHGNSNRLDFIDISSTQFNPTQEGLDGREVHREFHVKRHDGTLIKGVDAFIEIWRVLGILSWLTFLAEHQPTRSFFKFGYAIFVRLRPFLPKKECKIENL